MVFDLKYHITTIIAIFLSLGIGILIGSAMIGDDGIVMEQQKIIVQIEEDLRQLRVQNYQFRTMIETLEENISEQEKFIDELFKDAISGKLEGLKCLWIAESSRGNQLLEVLKTAGLVVIPYVSSMDEKSNDTDTGDKMGEQTFGDFCITLNSVIPLEIEKIFSRELIFRPELENLKSKQSLYVFIKNLSNIKNDSKNRVEEDEKNVDFGHNSSI